MAAYDLDYSQFAAAVVAGALVARCREDAHSAVRRVCGGA
jgi:hypothetical protein